MPPISQTIAVRAPRKLKPVPWFHDGCSGLTIRARADVPSFDDSMIHGALLRGAASCERLTTLDRAINRELWPLGYVAHLERGVADGGVVLVEVAAGR
jgi:hypothetical protein